MADVNIAGIRIAYELTGEPDAPPMVLLHGLGSGAGSWSNVAGQLAMTHRVYAPDMRGHGSSDWPGTYYQSVSTSRHGRPAKKAVQSPTRSRPPPRACCQFVPVIGSIRPGSSVSRLV
jgi:pimeloyl-ACP methyl ester carboxylesterase